MSFLEHWTRCGFISFQPQLCSTVKYVQPPIVAWLSNKEEERCIDVERFFTVFIETGVALETVALTFNFWLKIPAAVNFLVKQLGGYDGF